MTWASATGTFTTAFITLFPIINPVGSAIIYDRVTQNMSKHARVELAGRIGLNAGIVLIVATWGGSALLRFFGIGLPAFSIAGGLIITMQAWQLLGDSRGTPNSSANCETYGQTSEAMSLVPLTIPFTTGPGTIAAAIVLGTSPPNGWDDFSRFTLGLLEAHIAMAALVWVLYATADKVVSLLGAAGARAIANLSAILLLCIGIQTVMHGLRDYWSNIG